MKRRSGRWNWASSTLWPLQMWTMSLEWRLRFPPNSFRIWSFLHLLLLHIFIPIFLHSTTVGKIFFHLLFVRPTFCLLQKSETFPLSSPSAIVVVFLCECSLAALHMSFSPPACLWVSVWFRLSRVIHYLAIGVFHNPMQWLQLLQCPASGQQLSDDRRFHVVKRLRYWPTGCWDRFLITILCIRSS